MRDLGAAYFELGRAYLVQHFQAHARAHDHFSVAGTTASLAATHTPIEQAALAFAEAGRVNPNAPAWYEPYARAVLLLAHDDAAGCAGATEAILDHEPDLEEVWKLHAEARARLDDTAGALAAYERALDIRRSDFECHLARAALLPPKQATTELHAALKIHPGLKPAHARLARLALDAAQLDEAEEHANAAQETYEGEVCRAELFLQRDDPARALKALAKARELPGCQNRVNYLEANAWLARARQTSGEEARQDLDRILALEDIDGRFKVPDSEPWRKLLAKAKEARARLT